MQIGIDINGLNPEDRARIAEIGFDPWLDEVVAAKASRMANKSAMPSFKRCALRSKCFHAKNRQAAHVTEGNGDYCSPLCRESARSAKLRRTSRSALNH